MISWYEEQRREGKRGYMVNTERTKLLAQSSLVLEEKESELLSYTASRSLDCHLKSKKSVGPSTPIL